MILHNNALTVEISDIGSDYRGSRYDWSGIVKQVTLYGKSTFLSREIASDGGCGLGGIGLCSVFEWADTSIYDSTAFADSFPMIGVGLLKKSDTLPFQFTKAYEVTPFEREVLCQNDTEAAFHTLPHFCNGIAVDQRKTVSLQGTVLTVTHTLHNVGEKEIRATEFSHNFFRFGADGVDRGYRLQFPYSIAPTLRRGSLLIERDAYRVAAFDQATASTAFWVHGYEGMKTHWMKLTRDDSPLSVLVEDLFPVVNFYSWNNKDAFCPETFCGIALKPGESTTYSRRYTFSGPR
ncbi:aldose 1-epimerase [Anaerotruncus sp. AF02-27]|uniref:aldose 1-epimerase n=1 Tax=Anaerotruncus TaxID=244127 RepID=UPI000E4869CA|nr:MULTISPECIES: aldose 1-epimerase [Anaerotruncus]RGX54705.1 aldose 1-epimerase [Anaerotruncus sp. AF02-27]